MPLKKGQKKTKKYEVSSLNANIEIHQPVTVKQRLMLELKRVDCRRPETINFTYSLGMSTRPIIVFLSQILRQNWLKNFFFVEVSFLNSLNLPVKACFWPAKPTFFGGK